MSRRKYVSDYRLSGPGGVAYVGEHFEFEDPARARLGVRRTAIFCFLGWIGFAEALLPLSGGGTAFWSVIPLVFSALPLGIASAALLPLLCAKGPMIRSSAERVSRKLPLALLWALCLTGAALLGEAVLALFFRERLLPGDGFYAMGAALECGACALGYAERKALAVRKTDG